ncbi:MAG: alpha/beta hydrolase [Candidatus Binatia bacterium]|nr:alpha/beta hydrolase [Candidatus Binatia bacterium]MDG1957351.1 alpha/beta hydrolase [Candidatus Binatia bacterium]MDG2011409.1 alpha/beta hydrolase [Candidatus Binatia bacterium]HAC79159.1 alpha/beta hydrolase [Deltaproteobacteria bacterium]
MAEQPSDLRLHGHHGNPLHADCFGPPDGAPIVFVHGGGQTRHSWHATARTLADLGWFSIALDQRGHGDSAWDTEGRYHYTDFAGDLEAVVQSLDQKPVLVGASLGGIACLLAEGGRPQPFARALILVDIAARMDPAGAQRIMDFMLANPEGFPDLDAAADAVAAYNPHRPRPASNEGLAKNLRLGDDGRWRWHWDPRFMSIKGRPQDSETVLDDAARALTLPTLLIRGQKSDLLTMEQVEHFLGLAPHAQFTDVGGAGHMVAGDRNDVFSEAVLQFLDSLSTEDS